MMKRFAEDIKADFALQPYYGGTLFKQGTELVALQRGQPDARWDMVRRHEVLVTVGHQVYRPGPTAERGSIQAKPLMGVR